MPVIGILHLLIAIGFVLHAHKTGRPQVWMYILLFVPFAGSVAYILFEILPEMAGSRRARKVANNLTTIANPDGEWKRLRARAEQLDSVEAKVDYAEECARKGMWGEAVAMYRQAAVGMYADDPEVLRGMARVLLGSGDAPGAIAVLNHLRTVNPNYQNQDAHLTFARSLEAQDKLRDAEVEYRELVSYFVGMEARARYGLLLQRLGEPIAAKQQFEDVLKASKMRGVSLSDDDHEWIRVARKQQ
jgi:hypothetical protein